MSTFHSRVCIKLIIFSKNLIWNLIYLAKSLSDTEWKFIIDDIHCVNQRWAVRKSANLRTKLKKRFADLPQMWQFAIWGPSYFCGLKTSANPQIHGWRTGTTTLCRSWLYPPVRDLWIRLLYLKRWEVEPAFAERDRKHTMIDLRGISTNWLKNQLCPFIMLSGYGLSRSHLAGPDGPFSNSIEFLAHL